MQFGNTDFTKRLSYGGGGGGGGGSAHGDDPNSGGRGGHGGGLVYLLLEELTFDGTIESKGNTLLLRMLPFYLLITAYPSFQVSVLISPPTHPTTPHTPPPLYPNRMGVVLTQWSRIKSPSKIVVANTLQGNCHVLDVIQKVNKRIYFLKLLKHANVPAPDIICFYICIRPVLEYIAPLYHYALPDY